MSETVRPRSAGDGAGKASRPRTIRGLDAAQRVQQRRSALLDAGLELFAAQGYAKTSIEQLCQQAYVGTKAFYETFASRDDLYEALLRRVVEEAFGRLAELVTDHEGAPDLEARVIEEFAHIFVDDVRVAKVTFGEGSAITPEAERHRRRNRREAAAFVEAIWAADESLAAPAHGTAVGLVGGLFDLIADWVIDLPEADEVGIEVLIERLQTFYATLRDGMRRHS